MAGQHHVFISYNSADRPAAALVHQQLTTLGLSVFWDVESLRAGDLWLERLQHEVDGCGAFVVLVGRDGVRRWVGAEAQAALNRYFGPQDDAKRLPIFPILLDGSAPDTLPAFLRLFQVTRWTGLTPLPDALIASIREKRIVADETARFDGCPFVGLAAFGIDQANMFFGRQKETLDALACFDRRPGARTVRWLEITGNSGSGKSSLMSAGILPLVEQGWLWPRTGFKHWRRIGPLMPGERPVAMLAECLARGFGEEMADVRRRLEADECALAEWLRGRKDDDSAFLLAIDQFEELFTFADPDERRRFDRLVAAALEGAECPLFVISTVRADFLDRFDDLPRLAAVQNRVGWSWKMPPIGAEGLREIIDGPARLAGLDVSDVREAMVQEAEDEPGALPLVENALFWLWEKRSDGRLSGRLLSEHGGIAGILSRCADDLLASLDARSRDGALELLFRMVLIDPEGRRHTRRRIPLAEAIAIVGGGERGHELVDRLAGRRLPNGAAQHGPLRLITVTEDTGDGAPPPMRQDRWVNLIHETLIRSKGLDAAGKPQPYWPTLWEYIEKNKERAARRERLQLMVREWKDRRGLSRLSGLAGWSSLFGFRKLASPGSIEWRYLRWSRARAAVEIVILAAAAGIVAESVSWAMTRGAPFDALMERWAYELHIAKPALPELVKIPAGSFIAGEERPNEQPPHRITIDKPLYFSRTEVTFRQWDACVADGGCNGYRPGDQGWGREVQPVINVSWADAQAYVAWLSRRKQTVCRLPNEAEWEYAARAGSTFAYALPPPDGSEDITDKNIANCVGCGTQYNAQAAPVASFLANRWGLHDMHANVWEWVEDCYHENYENAPQDGRAWREEDDGRCNTKIMRGGAWDGSPREARSGLRYWHPTNARDSSIGFRVVCSSLYSGH